MATKFSAFAAASALAAADILVGLQAGDNVRATMAQVKTFTNTNVTLAAGQAGAGLAPMYWVSGPLLSAPVVGAQEFLTDKWYGTITTGTSRKEFTLNDQALTANNVPYVTTNGRLTDSTGLRFNPAALDSDAAKRLGVEGSVSDVWGVTIGNTSSNSAAQGVLNINSNGAQIQLGATSSTFGTSGLITARTAYIRASSATTGPLIIATGAAASPMVFIINGTGGSANQEIGRFTGDPNANGGADFAVKTNNTGTVAFSRAGVYNSAGMKGFMSVAGTGFTTVGIYAANNVNVAAVTDNLNLITETAGKVVNVVTGGTAAANIVATFAGGGTITASAPMLTLAQTWNNSGVTFTGVLVNVTNTASAAASMLQDWQIGGSTRCKILNTGVLTLTDASANTLTISASAGGLSMTGNTALTLGDSGGTSMYLSRQFGDVRLGSALQFGWSSATSPSSAGNDVILVRSAAAVLQQGAANAASPIAQTLQAQGSRSGTDTNVAGASYTIRPGAGTGNATPGALIFQSYVAVASGTGVQTATTTLTLNSGNGVFAGSCDAASYKVGGVAGADFGPGVPTSITVVKGIVTAIS